MEDEIKAYSFGVKDGNLEFGIDSNKDGKNVISGKIMLSEAMQEAFSKGTAVAGVKTVDVKFDLTKLKITVDTDRDGEPLLELEVDLAEAFKEITQKISG